MAATRRTSLVRSTYLAGTYTFVVYTDNSSLEPNSLRSSSRSMSPARYSGYKSFHRHSDHRLDHQPGPERPLHLPVTAAEVSAGDVITARSSTTPGWAARSPVYRSEQKRVFVPAAPMAATRRTPLVRSTTAGTYTLLCTQDNSTGTELLKVILREAHAQMNRILMCVVAGAAVLSAVILSCGEPAGAMSEAKTPNGVHGTVTPGTSLSSATPTAVDISTSGENGFYTFSVTASEVSADDVITAQVYDDSGLGGSVAILGPGDSLFYSSGDGGNQTYVTSQVNTPGKYTFEVAANNSTGTEELKVIFPVNAKERFTPAQASRPLHLPPSPSPTRARTAPTPSRSQRPKSARGT